MRIPICLLDSNGLRTVLILHGFLANHEWPGNQVPQLCAGLACAKATSTISIYSPSRRRRFDLDQICLSLHRDRGIFFSPRPSSVYGLACSRMSPVPGALVDFVFGGKPIVEIKAFRGAAALRSRARRLRNHLTAILDKDARIEVRSIVVDSRQPPRYDRRSTRPRARFCSGSHVASLMWTPRATRGQLFVRPRRGVLIQINRPSMDTGRDRPGRCRTTRARAGSPSGAQFDLRQHVFRSSL